VNDEKLVWEFSESKSSEYRHVKPWESWTNFVSPKSMAVTSQDALLILSRISLRFDSTIQMFQVMSERWGTCLKITLSKCKPYRYWVSAWWTLRFLNKFWLSSSIGWNRSSQVMSQRLIKGRHSRSVLRRGECWWKLADASVLLASRPDSVTVVSAPKLWSNLLPTLLEYSLRFPRTVQAKPPNLTRKVLFVHFPQHFNQIISF
jgi:hypothetical protein